MKNNLSRIGLAALSVILLTCFLGWRGSLMARRAQQETFNAQMSTQLRLGEDLVLSRIGHLQAQVLEVLSAEYSVHQNQNVNSDPSPALVSSDFLAVGLMAIDGSRMKPLWWSLQPEADTTVDRSLLKSFVPEWQAGLSSFNDWQFLRAQDLNSNPLLIFATKVRIPDGHKPALAIAVLSPRELSLGSTDVADLMVWDDLGYSWGSINSSYLGVSLKKNALVKDSLTGEDAHRMLHLKSATGQQMLGLYAAVPGTNLRVGYMVPAPSMKAAFTSWWMTLLLAMIGGVLLSMAMLYKIDGDLLTEVSFLRDQFIKLKRRQGFITVNDEEEKVEAEAGFVAPVSENRDSEQEILQKELGLNDGDEEDEFVKLPLSSPEGEEAPVTCRLETALTRSLENKKLEIGQQKISCDFTFTPNVVIQGKASQVQTVIDEILKNSFRAMDGRETRKLGFEIRKDNHRGLLQIMDSGEGIAAENLKKIFDPFFTTWTESGCRGLGLSVVNRIVEMLNGEVQFESEPGQGTTVRLFFPLSGVVAVSTDGPSPLAADKPAAPAADASSRPRSRLSTDEMLLNVALGLNEDFVEDKNEDEAVAIRKPQVRFID